MNKLDFIDVAKLKDLLNKKEEEDKTCKVLVWVLAVIGVIAVVAGIAYAIHRYLKPDYLEDFDDEFEDDFEDEDDVFVDESK